MYRCGGHSSAYGFCGADDCSRCHPGGGGLQPELATVDELLDYLNAVEPDGEWDLIDHADLLGHVDRHTRSVAGVGRSFAEVLHGLR